MLFDWALIIFGTATDPLKGNPHVPIPVTTPPRHTTFKTGQDSDTQTTLRGKAIVYLTVSLSLSL